MTRYLALGLGVFLALAPAAYAAPALPMQVSIHPNPLPAGVSRAYVEVLTQPRVVCVAFVLFDNGTLPPSFPHAQTKVTSYRGTAEWAWYDRPNARGGTASVSCNNSLTTRTVNVHFRVQHDTPRTHATRPIRQAPQFAVRAVVSPNPIPATTYFATLTAYTSSGAQCVAGVFYDDGATAQSFAGFPQTASQGVVAWHWHPATSSGGGTATVTCSSHGKVIATTTLFTVKRR